MAGGWLAVTRRPAAGGLRKLDRMRAILVPVKSFRAGKHRLAGVLGETDRRALARTLGARVVAARGSAPAFVACDDDEVADWALSVGASVCWTPGLGLSGAVDESVRYLGTEGFTQIVVAHADLPFAQGLDHFGDDGSVTLAPDRRFDGTNVASVPTPTDFRFAYGPGSFERHRAEAAARGLACRSVYDWRLAVDVDLPGDLVVLEDIAARDQRPMPIAAHEGISR